MQTGTRALAVVAWVLTLTLLASWSETNAALVAAALVTVVTGAMVDRWWVLLVPALPAVVFAVTAVASDNGDGYEFGPEFWAAMALIVGGALVVLLAVGVGLRRAHRLSGGTGARPQSHG